MTLGLRTRRNVSFLDPRELPGLEAWYDAEHINGFGAPLPLEGDPVTQWKDLSGKNRHMLGVSSTYYPTFRKFPNLAPISSWTINGGASLAADGSVTTTTTSSIVIWIPIRGGNGVRIYFAADWYATTQSPFANIQPDGGSYFAATYWAQDKTTAVANTDSVPHVSNGNAQHVPLNTWTRTSGSFALGPGIYWVGFNVSAGAYVAAGTIVKNIDVFVSYPGDPLAAAGRFSPAVGNLPTVSFNGTNQFLQNVTDFNLTGGVYTIYTVFNPPAPNASGGNEWLFGNPTTSARFAFLFEHTGRLYLEGTAAASSVIASWNRPHIGVGVAFDQVGGQVFVDGVPGSFGNVGGPFSISGNMYFAYNGSSAFLGSISAALIFSRSHDVATRRKVSTWLSDRYSIPLARP